MLVLLKRNIYLRAADNIPETPGRGVEGGEGEEEVGGKGGKIWIHLPLHPLTLNVDFC